MKTTLKKILFFLLIQASMVNGFAQESKIKEAEVAYTKEEYSKTIEIYEDILQTKGESAAIYYNLGNAYFKTNQIASAILNYERALLLDPADADIRFNLQMAKHKSVDKIEPIGDFFLINWFDSIQNRGSADSWATMGIVSFMLFIGCLLLFFFSRWVSMKKTAFYVGFVLLALVMLTNLFASNQKSKLVNRRAAIVFSSTVTVKSSPDTSGTDLFVLHEGTKVSIRNTLGDWKEVEIEDGNIGWIHRNDIQII